MKKEDLLHNAADPLSLSKKVTERWPFSRIEEKKAV